ncbi:unnamed protein product [Aphanomyces euteiches]|uniref:Uncharacterized protein n=1 Tax=Aphanomyces euteiches TaxID=100861 RepID=A0A6G0XH67_9STRA|nr:hypothetical protein Ae201684_004726 [Aphanomyces euteiches]KAH9073257.1 hypothetical protein Ae201684P_015074 [Aphanomyces euteiches]KAH9120202.1 hypothetical protein LEN26_011233 [Aphanomyces euteiches]KAH9127771.1 hypothetical protein AeMF1_001964 [Aphanomyces euteiches]KAH9142996.1 hypothetical protein AeRB84_012972 [Aphanomyces euteiches]
MSMLATDKSAKWQSHEMESNVPLFERERRQDSQFVLRLQNELAETKRLLEVQTRQQNEMVRINEDLERRLENEACERINLDALKADDEKKWAMERARFEEEMKAWEKKLDDEVKRRAIVEERLRRAEKELYRMHQKKYDIEKAVRREESEKRKHEVYIKDSLTNRSSMSSSRPASSIGPSSLPSYLSIPPPNTANAGPASLLNPRDSKPATVRQRQALSSAMDFFGL